jgi:hypothetical protein
MALERKDVRAKLDPDMHAALVVLCDVDGLDIGAYIERVIVDVVHQRLHAASVIAERVGRLGISGKRREPPGISGNRRESMPAASHA